MKLRSFLSGLLSVVVLLVVAGLAGFVWITAHNPLALVDRGAGTVPGAAIFVPKQAPAMVSLLVNPDELAAFQRVAVLPSRRRQVQAEFNQIKQSLLAGSGLEYDRDVKPWLGDEVTLAITTPDIDRDRSNGQQPGYLLAIATQDPEQSREFLQLFWQKRAIAGADLVFEQYQGVKLIYGELPITANPPKPKTIEGSDIPTLASLLPTPTLASAVVGNQFVLFANDVSVLRDAITNVQARDLNLSHADVYQQLLATLTQPCIAFGFGNVPGLTDWLATPATDERPVASPLSSQKAPIQTIAIALGLERQGLMAETAIWGNAPKQTAIAPTLTQPVNALRYVPVNSPIAIASTNLNTLWQSFGPTVRGYATGAKVVDQSLAVLQSRWGLDLTKDVLQWVEGEYALGVLPKAAGDREKLKFRPSKVAPVPSVVLQNDWVFVAQRSTAQAIAAIAHLDDLAQTQGYSIGNLQLGEHLVSAWTKLTAGNNATNTLQANVRGVHGTVGDYEIFATSVPAIEQALKASTHPITANAQFQTAIAPFQTPNNGYLYLDWAESRPVLEQRFPWLKVVELAGRPLFSHLRSLTISNYGRQAEIQRGAVFLQLD